MDFLGMLALVVVILGLARVLNGQVAEVEENGWRGNNPEFWDGCGGF
jgi:hypothetical protein